MRISDGSIYKQDNGKWRFAVRYNTKPLREGGFATKGQARKAMEALKTELVEGKKQEPILFEDKFVLFLEKEKTENVPAWYANQVGYFNNHFKPFFKGKYLDDISEIHIQGYKSKRKDAKKLTNRFKTIALSTVNKELVTLKGFFDWCVDNDFLTKNPAKKVKLFEIDNRRDKTLTIEEAEKAMSFMMDALRARVWLAIGYGLRLSEAGDALLKNLNWKEKTLKVSIKKKRKKFEETIYLPDELLELLVRIPHGEGKRKGMIFRFKECKKSFSTALAKAGIDPDFTFHDLKHTAGTWLIGKKSLPEIQKFLHHANIQTTMTYLHVQEGDVQKTGLEQATLLAFNSK